MDSTTTRLQRAAQGQERPTVSELRKAADQEIDAAINAVLANLATEAYPLAKVGRSTSSRRSGQTLARPKR